MLRRYLLFNSIITWSDQQFLNEYCTFFKIARCWWTAPSLSDYTFRLAQDPVKEILAASSLATLFHISDATNTSVQIIALKWKSLAGLVMVTYNSGRTLF